MAPGSNSGEEEAIRVHGHTCFACLCPPCWKYIGSYLLLFYVLCCSCLLLIVFCVVYCVYIFSSFILCLPQGLFTS